MPNPTLADLLAQKAALEKQIAHTQKAERGEAIAQVRALMSQYGLTAADLASSRAAPVRKAGGGGKKAGGKVAIKYRNAATGDTWTGRGLQPKWLRAALNAGRKLSDFTV
jgi:DNA-binding protein H-NS